MVTVTQWLTYHNHLQIPLVIEIIFFAAHICHRAIESQKNKNLLHIVWALCLHNFYRINKKLLSRRRIQLAGLRRAAFVRKECFEKCVGRHSKGEWTRAKQKNSSVLNLMWLVGINWNCHNDSFNRTKFNIPGNGAKCLFATDCSRLQSNCRRSLHQK